MTMIFGLILAAFAQQVPAHDIVLRGGTVVDGSGAPRFRADVAIDGDRIARVARDGLPARSGRIELDATGLVVAPGFVDHHAHISTNVHERPLAENFARRYLTAAPGFGARYRIGRSWALQGAISGVAISGARFVEAEIGAQTRLAPHAALVWGWKYNAISYRDRRGILGARLHQPYLGLALEW